MRTLALTLATLICAGALTLVWIHVLSERLGAHLYRPPGGRQHTKSPRPPPGEGLLARPQQVTRRPTLHHSRALRQNH